MLMQRGEFLVEVGDTFRIDFHRLHFPGLSHEILREDAHARSDLQNGDVGTGIDGVGDPAGDA